jgi:hypothetical protein
MQRSGWAVRPMMPNTDWRRFSEPERGSEQRDDEVPSEWGALEVLHLTRFGVARSAVTLKRRRLTPPDDESR